MSLRLLAVAVGAVAVPMIMLSVGSTTANPTGTPAPGGVLAGESAAGSAGGTPTAAGSTARQRPAPPVPPDQTTRAAGFVVHRSVAGPVTGMVAAARADGVELTGWGYRSRDQQAALRMTNGCPDVDVSPSSSCRVPTARPGRSQHEAGLALDFRNCSTRETACHRWLAANAARYGFYNFPVEPWHWSTSGS